MVNDIGANTCTRGCELPGTEKTQKLKRESFKLYRERRINNSGGGFAMPLDVHLALEDDYRY